MYKHDQTFGGISVLLIGDFIQLPVTTGHDLWSVMYGTVSGNDGIARELFQQFRVKELTVNIRSSECVCVDLSSRQRGLFPILRLTKACWTYPPP
jgi:hypothetical protein